MKSLTVANDVKEWIRSFADSEQHAEFLAVSGYLPPGRDPTDASVVAHLALVASDAMGCRFVPSPIHYGAQGRPRLVDLSDWELDTVRAIPARERYWRSFRRECNRLGYAVEPMAPRMDVNAKPMRDGHGEILYQSTTSGVSYEDWEAHAFFDGDSGERVNQWVAFRRVA